MLDIYDTKVSQIMMIGAKCNQICNIVRAVFGTGRDMVNLDENIKTTYHTAIVITYQGLTSVILIFAASPVAITRTSFWIVLSKAIFVAIVSFFNLARKQAQFIITIGTINLDFVYTSGASDESLPFAITRWATTRCTNLRGPSIERFATYRASSFFLASAIVAVMLTTVLMGIDIFGLSAGVSGLFDFIPATAGT